MFQDANLTKYCKIKGSDEVGSKFPTSTTVKVEGSLKQSLKYLQAFKGSTFFRSRMRIGCTRKCVIKAKCNRLKPDIQNFKLNIPGKSRKSHNSTPVHDLQMQCMGPVLEHELLLLSFALQFVLLHPLAPHF